MAMTVTSMKNRMKINFDAIYNDYLNGEKSNDDMLTAMCQAILDEIQQNGRANVSGGSSAGLWPIE